MALEGVHPDCIPFSGPVVWTEHPQRIDGDALSTSRLVGVSVDHCKEVCLKTQECHAFNRNVPNGNCRLFSHSALETKEGIVMDRKSFSFFRTTFGKILDVMKMLWTKITLLISAKWQQFLFENSLRKEIITISLYHFSYRNRKYCHIKSLALFRKAASHYLSQCRFKSMSPYRVTGHNTVAPMFNPLRPSDTYMRRWNMAT